MEKFRVHKNHKIKSTTNFLRIRYVHVLLSILYDDNLYVLLECFVYHYAGDNNTI